VVPPPRLELGTQGLGTLGSGYTKIVRESEGYCKINKLCYVSINGIYQEIEEKGGLFLDIC
jgi:hypothetical protein